MPASALARLRFACATWGWAMLCCSRPLPFHAQPVPRCALPCLSASDQCSSVPPPSNAMLSLSSAWHTNAIACLGHTMPRRTSAPLSVACARDSSAMLCHRRRSPSDARRPARHSFAGASLCPAWPSRALASLCLRPAPQWLAGAMLRSARALVRLSTPFAARCPSVPPRLTALSHAVAQRCFAIPSRSTSARVLAVAELFQAQALPCYAITLH